MRGFVEVGAVEASLLKSVSPPPGEEESEGYGTKAIREQEAEENAHELRAVALEVGVGLAVVEGDVW